MATEEKTSDSGFTMNEVADIILEQYQHQITDEEPDPERSRASAHRGAAYMDPNYPPGGSSSGQEGGGDMADEVLGAKGANDILILGCGYTRGLDVLGGAPPIGTKPSISSRTAALKKAASTLSKTAGKTVQQRAGFVMKKTAGGRNYTALKLNKQRGNFKATIANAKTAGERAVRTGNKFMKAIAKAKSKAATAGKATAGKATAGKGTPIHGLAPRGRVIPQRKLPGKLPGGKAPLQKLSLAQMEKVAKNLIKTGQGLVTKGGTVDKFSSFAKGHDARMKAGLDNTRKTYGPKGVPGTNIRGEEERDFLLDVLGAHCEVLGQAIEEEAAAPDAEIVETATGLTPPTMESIKPQPMLDYLPSPDKSKVDPTPYDSNAVPGTGAQAAGVVIYNKDLKPLPWQGAGSLTKFRPSADTSNGHGESGFQWGGGNPDIMDGWYWWWHGAQSGQQMKHDTGPQPTGANYPPYLKELAGVPEHKARALASVQMSWGPLIGNPDNADFKGLRYDIGADKWFWFYDEAPDWAKAPMEQALLQQAIVDYKAAVAAAKDEEATRIMTEQLEAKEATDLLKSNAKEDAADTRRIDKEKIQAEHEASVKAIEDERQAKLAAAEEERMLTTEERLATGEAEREERKAAAEEERLSRMMEKEAELEARAEERELDTLARLAAMTPPEEAYEEEPLSAKEMLDEEGSFEPSMYDFEQGPMPTLDEEFTELSGTARLNRHRI